jgi:hypothetical protein
MLASRACPSIESARKPAKRLCCRGDLSGEPQAMKIDSVEAIPVENRFYACWQRSSGRVEL